jgi:NAD(P)H dehydrogenase (quinone)
MNVLIVHAHHEPRSFSSAMKDRLAARLTATGHDVVVSDLYAMKFNPVSDRSNFIVVKNAAYLKQQDEEIHAHQTNNFAPDLASEMTKVLKADLLVLNFPLWWFGMPAILKGWVDRVMAMGKMYGGSAGLYENGVGRGKRALITATTGAPRAAYGKWGINPHLDVVLRPIQHGIFWFLGYQPLQPFVVHGTAQLSDVERRVKLDELECYASQLWTSSPLGLPKLADFPSFAEEDRFSRYMIEVRQTHKPDEKYRSLIPAEVARIAALQREGKLLFFSVACLDAPDWVGWLYVRESSVQNVEALLRTLPLYEFLRFTITEAARV